MTTAEAIESRNRKFSSNPSRPAFTCATISAEFGESFWVVIATPPLEEQKALTAPTVWAFLHIGRGKIARGHDDLRRQFGTTHSEARGGGELLMLTPQLGF